MITYVYVCSDCSIPDGQKVNKHGEKLNKNKLRDSDASVAGWHPESGDYVFFVESTMKDKPAHPACPKCKSVDTNQTLTENSGFSYIRGNCYLDKAGATRDMNAHKLRNEDPYGHMRVSGEVDHLVAKFKNAGRDMQKVNEPSIKRANRLAKVQRDKSKEEVAAISDVEKEIIKFIDKNEPSVREGVEFVDLPKIADINKVISELIKHGYVSNRSNGKFCLTSQGRWVTDFI